MPPVKMRQSLVGGLFCHDDQTVTEEREISDGIDENLGEIP